jgi:2-aminoadipate transaminase
MSDKPIINFTRGVPATESFPIEDLIAASKVVLQRYGSIILQYGKAYGFMPLREWLAEWFGVSVDQVMTANGSLQIVDFLSHHLLQPGDMVFTEAPSYDRTMTTL